MRLGLSLATNPKDSSFLVRAEGPCRGARGQCALMCMFGWLHAGASFSRSLPPLSALSGFSSAWR